MLIFEDQHVPQLSPVSLGKPAFAISCGSYRLFDLLGLLDEPMSAVVRPHLRDLVREDFPQLSSEQPGGHDLWVNARLVPTVKVVKELQTLRAAGRSGIVRVGDAIAAALLPKKAAVPGDQPSSIDDYLK